MSEALPGFFRLRSFACLASTNETAKELAAAGAPEGTLVTAAEQSAGRGRYGRSWASPPGNLYASLLLRPNADPAAAAQLGFAAALAVAEAAQQVFPPGAPVSLKWPNDVLVGGAKAAGILLESRGGDAGAVAWLVIGIGVNLASAPLDTPYPATCLAAWGAEVAPADFLPICAGRLLAWYEAWRQAGFAPVRAAWLGRAHPMGERLRVRLAGEELEGRFAGLDADGRLLLEGREGRQPIAAAEVFPAAP